MSVSSIFLALGYHRDSEDRPSSCSGPLIDKTKDNVASVQQADISRATSSSGERRR